jgi:predicted ABC-type exoprotein transport system permease subunit
MENGPEKVSDLFKKFGVYSWKDALCAIAVAGILVYPAYYAVTSIILGVIWIVVTTILLIYYSYKTKKYENLLVGYSCRLSSHEEDERAIKNASNEAQKMADIFLSIIEKMKKDEKIEFEEVYYGLAIARKKINSDDFPILSQSERLQKVILNELREEMSDEEIIKLANKIAQKRDPKLFKDNE